MVRQADANGTAVDIAAEVAATFHRQLPAALLAGPLSGFTETFLPVVFSEAMRRCQPDISRSGQDCLRRLTALPACLGKVIHRLPVGEIAGCVVLRP